MLNKQRENNAEILIVNLNRAGQVYSVITRKQTVHQATHGPIDFSLKSFIASSLSHLIT